MVSSVLPEINRALGFAGAQSAIEQTLPDSV
jgi:hypothetical protein